MHNIVCKNYIRINIEPILTQWLIKIDFNQYIIKKYKQLKTLSILCLSYYKTLF